MKKDKKEAGRHPGGAHAAEPGSHRLPVSQSISRLISLLLYFLLLIIQRTKEGRLIAGYFQSLITNWTQRKLCCSVPQQALHATLERAGSPTHSGLLSRTFFLSRDFPKRRACSQANANELNYRQLTPHHPPFPHICWKFYFGIGLDQGQK